MRFVRSALAAFAVSLVFSACAGGSPSFYPSGPTESYLPSGWMSVKVEAEAPFDFEHSQYNVLFNTGGDGVTPAPNRHGDTDWNHLSYGLIAGGDGKATAGPVAFERSAGPAIPAAIVPLRATPSQFTFNPNHDGLGTEYKISFQRRVFAGRLAQAAKTPWTFNVLVSHPNLHDTRFSYINGMSSCRRCFTSPRLDVTKPFDVVEYVRLAPRTGDPATRILRVEIANNP